MKKLFEGISVEEKVKILSDINPFELTFDEIFSMISFFRSVVKKCNLNEVHYGTFGTGGARYNTINASTLAAIVASCEIPVCKVGTTGVTSKWGSANLMEMMGYKMNNSPAVLTEQIKSYGFSFLYLGMGMPNIESLIQARRIVFNQKWYDILKIIGPAAYVTNPKAQVIGVYDEKLIPMLIDIINRLGKDALIVHNVKGIDELTNTSENIVVEIRNSEIRKYKVHPKELGIPIANISDIAEYEKKSDQAKISYNILSGKETGVKRDYICLNAGALFYLSKKVDSLKEGFQLSKELLSSGRVYDNFFDLLKKCGDTEKFLALSKP